MARVMINCPQTRKPLPTGMRFSNQSFETATLSGNRIGPCPHCGAQHTWDKKDAFLEDEPKQENEPK
jgi:hypothetical protein